MPKSETTSKRAAGAASRVLKDPKSSRLPTSSVAASALTQEATKVTKRSERVIKGVSHEHRDALKRLVDR